MAQQTVSLPSPRKSSQDSVYVDSSGSLDEEELQLQSQHDPLQRRPPVIGYFRSTIDCGWVDPETGLRTVKLFEPWFGTEVEVYTAANDPVKGRILYRASALATKFNCATNKVGMY